MPPREPRGLYLKREYFGDFEFQTELSAAERECYMGLWQLADDAGWLDWNPGQVAAHIYRFVGVSGQIGTELLGIHTVRLLETGRLKVLACGHAHLPRGEGHSRPGRPGNQADVLERHQKHSKNTRKYSPKKSGDSLPHLTVPNRTLTSPKTITPARAPARGDAPEKPSDILRRLGADIPPSKGH